ncbi:MAG: hypothetical protein BGO95_09515 [Micrococcales bacterium 73-13]|nr:MAG: hypothetical protein BGO95_09515 [Micrococcales bacterium 73-13]
MSKHDENREATRAELIRLGLLRFPAKGFTATSVREVLADSGISNGAFYYHFPSKEEYFLAVLEQVARESGDFAAAARASDATTLEGALGELLAALGENAGLSYAIADFVYANRENEAFRARIEAVHRFVIDALAAWNEVQQERGLMRTDRSASELAEMSFAAVEGHLLHHEVYRTSLGDAVGVAVRILQP